MDLPRKGRYRHFKGGEYEVIGVARHSETDEPLVIYRALYPCPDTPNGEGIWARPLSSWNAPAEAEGKSVPRFAPVADEVPLPEPPPEEAVFAAPPPEMPAAAPAPVSAEPCEAPEAVLKRVFGYETFREGQKETIDAILAGRDVLAVMPTGSGKSICYQVPALSLPGCALVISPLISLMKDQVAALKQSGVAAAFLNSSLTERQMDAALTNLADGRYKLVYVAPERLLTPRFLSLCRALPISMVAVDEAHCISQWGQDFRPSYLDIPKFIAALPERPRLCAFTATATKRVRGDIQRLLGLREPFALVTGFDRPNLRFFVERPRDRMAALFRVLGEHAGESGIVYCATRKAVEQVCDKLRAQGVSATRYHAGLAETERRKNQEDFSYDRALVMVATNAFGMGIDKSDVRFVVHYNMPKDLESYYQEAGRAGRDGEPADCVLLFQKSDVATQRFLIEKMGEEGDLDGDVLDRSPKRRVAAPRPDDRLLSDGQVPARFHTALLWRGSGGSLRRLRQLPAPRRACRTRRRWPCRCFACVQDINGRLGARNDPRDAAGQQGAARAGDGGWIVRRIMGTLRGMPKAAFAATSSTR